MNSPGTYTAEDIQRYHRGEMSASERHSLEKAALDDPLLADALEGYAHTRTAAADLKALQNRLQQRIGRDEKKSFSLTGSPWLKIAALFVLIAGAGWLAFQTFSEKDSVVRTTLDSRESVPRTLENDSITTVQTVAPPVAGDTVGRNQEVVAARANRQIPVVSPQAGTTSGTATTDATASAEQAEEASGAARLQEQGAVSDMATLRNQAPVSTAREATDTARQTEAFAELKNEKRVETARSRTLPPAAVSAPAVIPAEPEGGWTAFNRYITDNRQSVQNTGKRAATKGTVELQFDIDKEGNPTNILVIKSLCERCDAEATRLLKDGPQWKPANTRTQVKILF
jgi:hypothetical protein